MNVVPTHILYDEHCSPANLCTKVLDEQFTTIAPSHIAEERVIIQGLLFLFTLQREFLTGRVELE